MASIRLRQNKVVSFNEFLHEYTTKDGKFLMGVTGLMKKHQLSPDYGDIPKAVLERAAERGSAIHKMLEDYDNGKPVVGDENLEAYKKLGLRVHCSEYLVSDNEVVASFIDKVLEDCSIADIKTTAVVHTRALEWQLSIYAYLFELQNPKHKVPHLYCIHVRDGKAKQIPINRIPSEEVADLLLAETKGIQFRDNVIIPSVNSCIGDEQVANLVDALSLIAQYEEGLKKAKAFASELQEKIYQHMIDKNLKEMKCNEGSFVLKSPYERVSIDANALRKDFPEMAEKYSKTTIVKGSVIFKSNI